MGTFKEQIRIPFKLINEKTSLCQRRNLIELIVQILVHVDIMAAKPGTLQQKAPKSNHSWSNQFWKANANISGKVQYEKTSLQILNCSLYNRVQLTIQSFSPLKRRKREMYLISLNYV